LLIIFFVILKFVKFEKIANDYRKNERKAIREALEKTQKEQKIIQKEEPKNKKVKKT